MFNQKLLDHIEKHRKDTEEFFSKVTPIIEEMEELKEKAGEVADQVAEQGQEE